MDVQPTNESSFSTQQIQKQGVVLRGPEAYLSIGIKYVGVITKGITWKFNMDMLRTARIQCMSGAMAQWTVDPDLPTYPKC